MKKPDRNTCATGREGIKHKVARRRPHRRRWTTEYPDQVPEREVLIRIPEEQMAALKGPARGEGMTGQEVI